MGKTIDRIDEDLRAFINAQSLFFVSTAPLAHDGHVNLSPKGLDSLRVLDERTVAYLDLVGSGIETVAHLRENGRIVLLWCAFEGPPKIVRLHGQGEVIEPADERFDELLAMFPAYPGVRSVIRVQCDRISTSCGLAVPRFEYRGQRTQLVDWADQQGPDKIVAYQRAKNCHSIDGLAGLAWTHENK